MDNNSACTWCILSTHIGMTCQLSYYAVQLQAYINFSISAQIGLRITNQVPEICYSVN